MPPPIPSFYTLQYQAAPPLLRCQVLRPLSTTEFTESCELILGWAQHYHCPFWLLDGRLDDVKPLDLYDWLREDFLPHAYRALGRVPCLAFVAQAEFWLALQARGYALPPPVVLSATFRANWFTTEGEALAWLAQFRPAIGGQPEAAPSAP